MTSPLELRRTLDDCMLTIKDAGEAMATDMRHAAMKLDTATMMLASARNAVHKHAGRLADVPAQPTIGEPAPGDGS